MRFILSLMLVLSTLDIVPHEESPIQVYGEDLKMLAKLVYGEAGGTTTTDQKAAVVWCVLNRVDCPLYPDTIREVILQDEQFVGYEEWLPVTDECVDICLDVLIRYEREKSGEVRCGRILPPDFLYFYGDGTNNYYYDANNNIWDWSLKTPYLDSRKGNKNEH